MDIAYCNPAGRAIYAADFTDLPAIERETWRHQLTCTECGNPAVFRKQSRDGRAACFVGTPHVEGCGLASESGGTHGDGGTEEHDELFNPGDHIVIDLRLDFDDVSKSPGSQSGHPHHRGGRSFGAGDGKRRALMHRTLRTLLRTLVRVPEFASSARLIELERKITLPASQFFVEFKSAGAVPVDQTRGFWGKIVSARVKAGTLWLNTGGRGTPGLPIGEAELDNVLRIARVEELASLEGAHLLLVGRRREATNPTKTPYFQMDDLTRIAILVAK